MSKTKANGAIVVDKKVPIPESRGAEAKYPWAVMKVGDSFLAAGKTGRGMSAQVSLRGRKDGRKYALRTVKGGVRVWRIE